MSDKIYDSAPPDPMDDFWMENGPKLLAGSVDAVIAAAKSLMTALGLLKGIYLGILGFADFIPKEMPLVSKCLFITPLFAWLVALHFALEVVMTKAYNIQLLSPDDIETKYNEILQGKQGYLNYGYWALAAGTILAVFLLIFRLEIG